MADTNAELMVDVFSDEMSAIMFVMPPDGDGDHITIEQVREKMKECGIVHGIIPEEDIRVFIEKTRTMPGDLIMAKGTKPGTGTDGRIEFLFNEEMESENIETADEDVDHREKNKIVTVKAGTPLAKKIPPGRGPEGFTVTGRKTAGEWGVDAELKLGDNVSLQEDGVYVAEIDGTPRVSGMTISIDPVQVIDGDLDYETGNIDFEGAVDIRGNVMDGFRIKARGDVVIGGNVQSSIIEAGGNVIIGGGIFHRMKGRVKATGYVTAKNIENSIVEAEGNITVERGIISSVVRSNATVSSTSAKGAIMGGDVIAYKEIRAQQLGSEKEMATVLRAGWKYPAYVKMSALERELAKAITEKMKLDKALAGTTNKQSEGALKMEKTRKLIEARKGELQRSIATLKTRVHVNRFAAIRAEGVMYPGCRIYMGSARDAIKEPQKFAALSIAEDGGIELVSYDVTEGREDKKNVKGRKLPTVLVVDDTQFMRKKLTDILENADFKVVGQAGDGEQGYKMFNKLKPDIVTLDITMPRVDGIKALKAIRKISPSAKVIMISALGQKDKIKECVVSGASDFITKPFIPERVIEVVTRVAQKASKT